MFLAGLKTNPPRMPSRAATRSSAGAAARKPAN
jgi:hypothetical protein